MRGRLREALVEARLTAASAVVCLAVRRPRRAGGRPAGAQAAPRRAAGRPHGQPAGRARAGGGGGRGMRARRGGAGRPVRRRDLPGQAHPRAALAGREFLVADLVAEPRRHTARAVRRAGAAGRGVDGRAAGRVPEPRPRRAPGRPGDRRRHARRSSPATARARSWSGCGPRSRCARSGRGRRGPRGPPSARAGPGGLWALLRSLAAEADRPLRVVIGLLGWSVVVSVVVLQTGYVKQDGSHMTRRRRRLLHGRDDRDRRLRRLQLRRSGHLAAHLRHRPDGWRRDPHRDRVRARHAAAGEQADRAVVRAAPSRCDAWARGRRRAGHGGDRGRRGAGRGADGGSS